jgi:phosphoribosylamine--glycine ligase
MGAYSLAPVVTPELEKDVLGRVFEPVVRGMAARGCPFRGFLYAGLMIGPRGLQVLEFNARLGDPETQALLPRLRSDLAPALWAAARGELRGFELEWDPRPAVCVVLAARGYPEAPVRGEIIHGLEEAEALPDTLLFHAGTRSQAGGVVTAGGRVLGVCHRAGDVRAAIQGAYQAVEKIRFEGVHFRRDIGHRALGRIS